MEGMKRSCGLNQFWKLFYERKLSSFFGRLYWTEEFLAHRSFVLLFHAYLEGSVQCAINTVVVVAVAVHLQLPLNHALHSHHPRWEFNLVSVRLTMQNVEIRNGLHVRVEGERLLLVQKGNSLLLHNMPRVVSRL